MEEKKPGIRLLLVDDEAEFRSAAGQALRRQGFEVTEAESGERALEVIPTARPDVIILDLKQLGARVKRLVEDGDGHPLREKKVGELMVPQARYHMMFSDQMVSDAVEAFMQVQRRPTEGDDPDRGRRTLLVFHRGGGFAGLVRAQDIVRLTVPSFLRESPYSSYFTGMFLAQAKVIGRVPLKDLLRPLPSIDVDAPLMEAAYFIVTWDLSHLPVTDKGELVGILRPEDLYREIASLAG